MRPICARRRDAAVFHLGPPRLGQPEIRGSQQTLRWREPNSNLHSLSYDLPRTELDRVGPAHADLCRDFFSRAVVLELSFFEAAIPACARSETSARVLQGCGSGYAHMLGTNADPNQPGRNATQNRKNLEELEE